MRILFVKTSSLGDVIHNCPAVSDLRRRFPDAAIDWVVEEPFAAIVAMHSAVRRVIPVAVRRWRSRLFLPSAWRDIMDFRRNLRMEVYDLVVDTQGLLKSAVIARGAIGVRHGYDADSAREPMASRLYDVRHAVSRELHAVERNRLLTAAAAGLEHGGECDYGFAAHGSDPVTGGKRFCVLLSMTSRADKLWPEGHWAELVRALAARGMECILPWGSEVEQARCRRIVARSGSGSVPRRQSLVELTGMMAGARTVFGVDTGLAHLAAALGVPTIGLYCSTDPARTGLYGGRNIANLGGPGRVPSSQEAVAAMEAME